MSNKVPEWYTLKLYRQLKCCFVLSVITVTFIHLITGDGVINDRPIEWVAFLIFGWLLYRLSDYIFPQHANRKDT